MQLFAGLHSSTTQPFLLPNANLSGRSPSILLRKTVRSLKSPTGAFIAPLCCANANLSGRAPPSCLRKTVRSLKSPTGAFIAPLRCANANLSGRVPPSCCARPFGRLKTHWGFHCSATLRKREQRSFCSAQNPASFGVKLAYGVVFTGNSSKEKS